jgi:hypothetical protein
LWGSEEDFEEVWGDRVYISKSFWGSRKVLKRFGVINRKEVLMLKRFVVGY